MKIRITIYRLGSTVEIMTENPEVLKMQSGETYWFDCTKYAEGQELTPDLLLKIRPYYRRTINGIINIFAEEEVQQS